MPEKRKFSVYYKKKEICGICGCYIKTKALFEAEKCPDVSFGEKRKWA